MYFFQFTPPSFEPGKAPYPQQQMTQIENQPNNQTINPNDPMIGPTYPAANYQTDKVIDPPYPTGPSSFPQPSAPMMG